MTFDDLFALTPAGGDPGPTGTTRWTAPGAPRTDERMVFGGLVIGQAIVAASHGTRRCHALHAFFIGMGEKAQHFDISVESTRDGGSFATRHFQVRQDDRLLLAGYSSHHDGNDGPEHQITMPDAPPPKSVEDYSQFRIRRDERAGKPPKRYLAEQMLDVRYVEPAGVLPRRPESPHVMWFRCREPIQGSPAIHQAAIGFASDVGLVHAGLKNHARVDNVPLQTASLDHSIWFHRETQANDWMLYVLRSPILRNGRGLSHGAIFSSKGELVASVAQEFLARTSRPKPST